MTAHVVPHVPVRVIDGENLRVIAARAIANQTGQPAPLTEKIVVNFIRHKLTPYDAMMDKTRVAKDGYAQRAALRRATLTAIAEAYAHVPYVAAEAKRQLRETEAEAHRRDILHATAEDIAAYRKGRAA